MMRAFSISAVLIALVVVCGPVWAGDEAEVRKPVVMDFKRGAGAWKGGPKEVQFSVVSGEERGRKYGVARLTLHNERQAKLVRRKKIDLSSYDALRFDAYVPKTRAHLHFALYFIDEDDFWFQTWRPLIPKRNAWNTFEIDLRASSAQFQSENHGRPWGPYVARGVKEMGLAVFADDRTSAKISIDRITLVPVKALKAGRRPQRILDFETSGDRVGRHERFEIDFKLSRVYDNPYDPDEISIWGVFTSPSGKTIRVPGFFFQDYARRLDQKMERLIPVGSPKWKIRFAPREIGRYTYRVEVVDHEDLKTDAGRFVCVASKDRGNMRACKTDPRYFELGDGSFFYPIGHNIPATFNAKGAEQLGLKINQFEGTFAYDRFLEGMARGKENYARIWLASWSFGLEWSRSYHPSYRGLGRYNQEHAWKFDYVLNRAEKLGIYVQLALTTFGHWRVASSFEGDWAHSPYNARNGGPLTYPQQFWTNEKALKLYDRMLRYVMARWGYSSHIAAWEISNEIDLVTNYKKAKPDIIDWHRRCVKRIREFDPNPHLVTTNFAVSSNDKQILSMPEIQFSSTNHYHVYIIKRLRKSVIPDKLRYLKPAIMAETGYDFKGAKPDTTERYLHICLWATHMMPFGGAGLSWWWGFIDDRNLYPVFKPLVAFSKGEDRRNRKLEMSDGGALDAKGVAVTGLKVITLQNDHSGYFWMFESSLLRAESDFADALDDRKGVVVAIGGLKDGDYAIEFWDTVRGTPLKTVTATSKGRFLTCPVPQFLSDIAAKIRPAKAAPSDSESSEPDGTPASVGKAP